ncbi:magnesium and cobalt transport protein CorA [Dokdonia sinensis]|uniref:Magnesium transport protein CorA n=1 Tax=Dokdonia sinensis TaxID=2479847 RepID=A0A3M0G6K4_9FLAO|nr:magnesium/cobalt transporter CorA [Dokdonia sinensis]RMB60621.1 magnesium and cobalt transport protein CorA [Dokdonia sinensis]
MKLKSKVTAPFKRKSHATIPGSIIYTGNNTVEKVSVHHLKYDEFKAEDRVFDSNEKGTLLPSDEDIVDWYDVRGMQDTNLIEAIGKTYGIHPLILESIVDVNQRPRFDENEKGIFITIRALHFDKEKQEISKEHVAIYLIKGLVISFQETSSDLFESVRDRILSSKGRVRQRGSDYLVYALLDAIIDNYYITLDSFESVIEQVEDDVMEDHHEDIKGDIHNLKKELIVVRKSIAPLREALSRFSKTENTIVYESTFDYLRSLYENTVQIMDSVESYRDMLNSLQDLFMTEVSYKMNKVMQVLTIVSTIFIPLTFVAGIYGMNFDHIPELHFKNGYFIAWGFMIVVALLLVYYFKRRKWL